MSQHSENGKGNQDQFVNIIVNARPKKVYDERISYEEVVELAFSDQVDPNIVYTVAYAGPQTVDGTLVAGQSVAIRNGMKFDVNKTNRS
ncbi:multiubiquitin domain-containing protein [Acinetobacter sp. C_4_1]|uniref:multiubiquitin domain-containing protein n=1 Tax=unclassified Acinetobacter TaxID=196816 RepID=UPI0021B83966|nr:MULTISPECIES: multiubiquitin domain-containing protein [unclassified Acinetobacter]MCT8088716.1 multiubiquitin domain-containing protein [Acinetobacter sp. F_3_1]MCT8096872.1 multiubiquitin domain-containing protein [Acinetobacter sp. C_3_1]MCT8099747.1 multiubiquitin domain-containing protein [Acinetobacter sp. C_4_1]MCT8133715.1 multiubiquitin domain-containing protein [Acinetobacter sp. T_3_1]